jgi:hypothetical protein
MVVYTSPPTATQKVAVGHDTEVGVTVRSTVDGDDQDGSAARAQPGAVTASKPTATTAATGPRIIRIYATIAEIDAALASYTHLSFRGRDQN